MRRTTVEKANFRLIESELYGFSNTVRELEQLKNDIIHAAPIAEEIRASGISKTTEQKALKMISSAEILELSRRVNAIQFSIETLKRAPDPKRFELLRLKYFEQRLTDTGIMKELNIESATFYRWRKDIIRLVAGKLGWKV